MCCQLVMSNAQQQSYIADAVRWGKQLDNAAIKEFCKLKGRQTKETTQHK